MKKRLILFLLAFSLMTGFLGLDAQAAESFSPASYDRKAGYAYVALGQYASAKDGTPAPLLWRVLKTQNNKSYLMSDLVIDTKAVDSKAEQYTGYEKCELQLWLNGAFYKNVFSDAEKPLVSADLSGYYVSLPEDSDLKDEAMGFISQAARQAKPSAYAKGKDLNSYQGGYAPYWTRTLASKASSQRAILKEGSVGYKNVDDARIGIRPVIWLDLAAVSSFEGTGSRENPYRLIAAQGAKTSLAAPQPTASSAPEQATAAPLESPLPQKSDLSGFPQLTAEGFLPENEAEYIQIDPDRGVWRYASQGLRVEIIRHLDEKKRSCYFVAEIFVKPGEPSFRMVPNAPGNMKEDRPRNMEKPALIAQKNNLVFSMDGDYFIYRVGRSKQAGAAYPIGVVIRGGEILFDVPPPQSRTAYPPLDMLALYPDGDMKVFKANELSAAELLKQGAQDVLSFGPYLIRDGQVNQFHARLGNTPQPRACIGMAEKGHYFAVIYEGRIKRSQGSSVTEMAKLMKDLGCRTAFNLDGGWTSAMVFMGKQINQLDASGVHDNARTQNEVMGIGHSSAFPKP